MMPINKKQPDPIDMNDVEQAAVNAVRLEWIAEFEAAARRPLAQRARYAFIRTYKPVLDDAPFRSFDSMSQYRAWCNGHLPFWLGYHR